MRMARIGIGMRFYQHLDMPSAEHMQLMEKRFDQWRDDPYWYVTVSCFTDDMRTDQYPGYAEFWSRYNAWQSLLIVRRNRLGRWLSCIKWRLLFALDPPNRLEREAMSLLDDHLRSIGDPGLGMDKWIIGMGSRSSGR